jgi:hypothetical protein
LSTIRRRPPQAYINGELCGARPDSITSFGMIQVASDTGNASGLVFFLSLDRFLTFVGDDRCPLMAMIAEGRGR